MQQYLLPLSVKTWFFLPLDKNWFWFNAHRYIAWHMVRPLFSMASDSFLGRQMNVGKDAPGRIWRRPSNAHFVSATQISPSRTQRQLTTSISNLFWMLLDSLSPPSQTTTFFLMLSKSNSLTFFNAVLLICMSSDDEAVYTFFYLHSIPFCVLWNVLQIHFDWLRTHLTQLEFF